MPDKSALEVAKTTFMATYKEHVQRYPTSEECEAFLAGYRKGYQQGRMDTLKDEGYDLGFQAGVNTLHRVIELRDDDPPEQGSF